MCEISEDVRKIAVKLKNEGKSLSEIGKTINLAKSTVDTIIRRYNATGTFASAPRSGRPTKIDERTERVILRRITENPKLSAVKLSNEVLKYNGIDVHPETIRRCLKKNDLKSHVARKKPFVSQVNIKKRLDYALKYQDIHLTDQNFWERVIFTDECKFNVFGSDGICKVWRKPNSALATKNLRATVKHGGGSVMVWGCMSANGVGKLKFIDGIMNARMYIDILKEEFLPSVEKLQLDSGYTFMHDNDPKHSSLLVREWLLYNVNSKLEHPPQSPDLNVIEHLWAYLKVQVQKANPSSVQQLKSILTEEWEKVPPELTKKLAFSMPKRLKEVIKLKGGPTSY